MLHVRTLAALLLAAPAALQAQEAVTLDFRWPEGSARVSVSSSNTTGVMGQSSSLDAETAYTLTVAREGDHLRISYSDFTFDGMALEQVMRGAGSQDPSQAVSGIQPDILVSTGGAFMGLADYAAHRAATEEALAATMAEMEAQGMGDMLRDVMEATLAEDVMAKGAEMVWNQMAGFWAGRTMNVGATVTVPGEVRLPMLGTEPVVFDTELQVLGRTACEEGAEAADCLELATSGTPDPEEIRNLMDIFMADMAERAGGSGMEMGITRLEMAMTSTLVVDAETLRPRRMASTMDMAMEMDVMGMRQGVTTNQVVTTRFAWER